MDAQGVLPPELLDRMDAYWRAANYLTVGQIYLKSNPLLKTPLSLADIKSRLLGHWGTTTGLNFLYTHLNRLIVDHDLDMIFVAGPGHGGPGLIAQSWLEGSYTEQYPGIERTAAGMERLFRQFSWPYGVPSHVAPSVPGSIHEGGELGYSIVHAFGAAFDNPDLIVACVVGDGEAETGPLAASWHSNKFLNPCRDGAVLPILHLNGFKIANPTILARIPQDELSALLTGYGWEPHFVEGDDPPLVHQALAATLDTVLAKIKAIQTAARETPGADLVRPRWPMIVFRTPKGWTGPKTVDGLPVEGTWRAHQVPIDHMDKPDHLALLETWLKSYRAEELFDDAGAPRETLTSLAPTGHRRMSANPHANGGGLLRPLAMPDFRDFAIPMTAPGSVKAEATRNLGRFLREVMTLNLPTKNFRLFGPDETASNRLEAVYDASGKTWMAQRSDRPDVDTDLAQDGRVMEVLSEHLCEGWLEGYLLTGRHGLFSCYEAFIHIVDSMFNQHAKWLEACNSIAWREPIASLNYLLTSHVWQQDHNGFSHQDPGFIDHVANKRAKVTRIYLPPDANTLLSVTDHCLRSRNYVNLIVAGKAPEYQWLDIDAAARHCADGAGVWDWASSPGRARRRDGLLRRRADHRDPGRGDPAAGLRAGPEGPRRSTSSTCLCLGVRAISTRTRSATAISTACSPTDKPVIFAFHGYPGIVHKLTYNRNQPRQLPRPWLRRAGLDHHAVRHDRPQRPRPLHPRPRRHPPAFPGWPARSPPNATATAPPWSATNSGSSSTARTCLRLKTGSGQRHEILLHAKRGGGGPRRGGGGW